MQFGRVSGLEECDEGEGRVGWVGVVEGESEEGRRTKGRGCGGRCDWGFNGACRAGAFGDVGAGIDGDVLRRLADVSYKVRMSLICYLVVSCPTTIYHWRTVIMCQAL